MFIDEGFGTLDEAALDQALQLLDKLAGGERLVGIIFHVSALEQRIDRKILVEKTATGSSLRLEYSHSTPRAAPSQRLPLHKSAFCA